MTPFRALTPIALLVLLAFLGGCWIPLPEETAIVVQVRDGRGNPVDGASFLLDASETITTGTQLNEGQVFKSLNDSGDHTLQLETQSLIDPQGGVGWVPLASQISGELLPLSFGNRPFAGGSEVLYVPVNKGEITVVTIYLEDILESPGDNQWLTDGSNASPYRIGDNTDEFSNSPEPVFWWRQDPSLGVTVGYTFQLWEDGDGDSRFPLGVADHPQYQNAMNPVSAAYRQPDWQVPLAGIQRSRGAGVNRVSLWSSQASDATGPITYDLYYAPTVQWNNTDWEKNPVARSLAADGTDGGAVRFTVGGGSANPGVVLKNGVTYTFALRARDGASNLDSTGPTATRKTVPSGSSNSLGAVTSLAAVADSATGGRIDLTFLCQVGDNLRIYAAPAPDFNARRFDVRFIRGTGICPLGSIGTHALTGLVNGVNYAIGVEPFDASGNVGTASSVVQAVPSSAAAADTVPPTTATINVTRTGPGQVSVDVSAVSDSTSSVFRRVYWAAASFTANAESMMFTDLAATPDTSILLSDIPSQVPYNYVVRAIDAAGNSALAATQFVLTEGDTTGPTWASDEAAFFSTIRYAAGTTVWPLGATWAYGSPAGGFALRRNPAQGQGEYVWRVVQENPDRGVTVSSKLGAFYTYSGYYYASTEAGGLAMSTASANAAHRDVFAFVEAGISSADVMGAPFDSSSTSTARFRQRTAAQFSASLAAGSGTTTQMAIFYNTDEDGLAVVSRETGGGYLGIMRTVASNKQRPLPTPQPHLQSKEFLLSYFTDTDGLVTFPVPLFGGGVYYSGTLEDPDYLDPLW